MMLKRSFTLTGAFLLFAGAAVSHASLIAFDPFHSTSSEGGEDPANGLYYANPNTNDGSVASALNAGAIGGEIVGFGSHPWESSTTTFNVQVSSLDSPSRTPTLPGAIRVRNFRGTGPSTSHRTASRQLDAYTPSSTYYMSSIIQPFTADSGHAPNAFLMLGFGNSMITDSSTFTDTSSSLFEGVLWGFRANETGDQLDLVVRATTDAGTQTVSDFVLVSGVTQQQNYFVAVRLDVDESGADTLSVWLDPDFSLSEPVADFVFSVDAMSSLASITHFGMAQNGLLHTGVSGSINRVGYIDAITLGTTYASVVPEPSTYALLLGGASLLGLIAVRIRRKAQMDAR